MKVPVHKIRSFFTNFIFRVCEPQWTYMDVMQQLYFDFVLMTSDTPVCCTNAAGDSLGDVNNVATFCLVLQQLARVVCAASSKM